MQEESIRIQKGGSGYGRVYSFHIKPIVEHLIPMGFHVEYAEAPPFTIALDKSCPAFFFLSHGLADKNWRNARDLERFAYVGVSGPAWVDKLVSQGFPKDRVWVIGYPLLDPLFQEPPPQADYIFWGPTHLAIREVSSARSILELLEVLRGTGRRVIVEPHPAEGGLLACEIFRNEGLPEAVISDSSSVLYEAWAFGIPVIFPDFLVKEGILKNFPNSFEALIYREALGCHVSSLKELLRAIEAPPKLSQREKTFIESIFPSHLRGRSGEEAASVIAGLWRKERARFLAHTPPGGST